ncbi:YhgE/Pip domain-containing protein [Paenibacillus sp. J5C_2022]|uniref:YhgE/Pip domain-containing protein n=1 Tax=Paenibacillus sp. J5C2022 TaxID=2977129 RepID=UPI0021D2849D|nr:YhgE/Pip domain-containing protein [Paenibacillus sp. J5C2022]MCU6709846.1 YhgE/Pip domain-containing protein [Paenibacillus sp. J5C2022]
MRGIWRIYKSDWLHLFKVPTGIFLVAAIIMLPCLYAWVNIKSVWDPYANTQGISVAVTSEDAGTTIEGIEINIGAELMESLAENKKLGWTFVSAEEAERGVDRGTYYASILIPEDFSARITGIVKGKLDRPEVIYTVNEKVNAIAPKITSSGVSTIAKQINESFTEAVSETLMTKLAEAGVMIEEQLPTLRKVEGGIFELEAHLPQIHAAGQKVLELETKLPVIHEKAQLIVEVEKKIPEINQTAAQITELNKQWPKWSETIQHILAMQEKLPELERAAARVQKLNDNFDQVYGVMGDAIDKSKKALTVVTEAQQGLERLGELAAKGSAFGTQLEEFLTANRAALDIVAPSVKNNLILVQQAADTVSAISARLLSADPEQMPTAEEVHKVKSGLAVVTRIMDHTIALLSRMNEHIPGQPLQDRIEQLQSTQERIQTQIGLLDEIEKALENGLDPVREKVERLHDLASKTSDTLSGIIAVYDSDIVPKLQMAIERLTTLASAATGELNKFTDKLPELEAILQEAELGLEYGLEQLTRLESELPAAKAKLNELTETLQERTQSFIQTVNKVVPVIQESLPVITKKLAEADRFIQQDLPRAEQGLTALADFVKHKLPELEEGIHTVSGLVRNDLPQLEEAVMMAADKLREVEANNHFAELAKLLRGDIQKESEFLASPVLIKENRRYAIPNYGSAMAPFYVILSVWVGATLLISLLKAEPDNVEGQYKPYQLYFGRWGTFVTIGMLQGLSITLGNLFILKTYVADKLAYILFAMLVSLVFVTITYTLLSVFGNVGKGIAIIFMVFQFSSSGGTFPVSMTLPFFQALNPFMPFTYAISLLRESVGGILWSTALRDILCLLSFVGLNFLLALLLKRPLSGLIKKSAENAKKTKLIA